MRVIDPKSELLLPLFGDLTKDGPESKKKLIAYLNHTKEPYNILTNQNHNEYYKDYQKRLPIYFRERVESTLKVRRRNLTEIRTEQELINRSISPKKMYTPIKQGKKRRIFIPKYRSDDSVPLTNYEAGILPPINKRIIELYKNEDKRSLSVHNRHCKISMSNKQSTPQSKLSPDKKFTATRNIANHFNTENNKHVIRLRSVKDNTIEYDTGRKMKLTDRERKYWLLLILE